LIEPFLLIIKNEGSEYLVGNGQVQIDFSLERKHISTLFGKEALMHEYIDGSVTLLIFI
jgi:hypothetical protein